MFKATDRLYDNARKVIAEHTALGARVGLAEFYFRFRGVQPTWRNLLPALSRSKMTHNGRRPDRNPALHKS